MSFSANQQNLELFFERQCQLSLTSSLDKLEFERKVNVSTSVFA